MVTKQRQGQLELMAQRRSTVGTRSTKRLREEGVIPCIVYGKATKPIPIRVEHKALMNLLHAKGGEHPLVHLDIQGDTSLKTPALVKALQYDPIDGHILHVDFQAITLTERIRVKVPVVLKGEAVGVKQEGGILEQFLREVEVECLPTEIPAHVEVDISALNIGQTLHVSDLPAVYHAKITTDATGVIASVQQPKQEKVEEVAPAVTEPEVIREKKEEAPGAPAEGAKAAATEAKESSKETKKEK